MNSVLDKPPNAPAVMDGIFGTSQIKVLDSLKNMRKMSNEGFRLQIYETSSKLTADSIVTYFQDLLSQEIYLVFEAPLYKLRIGDFLSKKNADVQKSKLEKMGIKNIWIVRSRISLDKI
tara:strand:+ start:53991 stop:54347 length:357 start_codon:yes stop_codon:yes gene_type:complete